MGWLVGWLLPLCPSARPGPPRLQAMGGRGCVTRCMSHEPRAPGLARAALARSRSVPSPVSGTSGSTALRAAPCPPVPLLCVVAPASLLSPPPYLWCARGAPSVSCRCAPAGAPRCVPPRGRGGRGGSPSALALVPCPPPPAGPARPPRVLPLPSLVACTGTGRVSGFILSTVSEGPKGRTSAALGLSSADVRHERGTLPTRDLCQ